MEEKRTIPLRCIFCKSTSFDVPYEGYEPKPGEQIKCANCGQSNDYTSLRSLARKEGEKIAKEIIDDKIKEFQKNIRKMFK